MGLNLRCQKFNVCIYLIQIRILGEHLFYLSRPEVQAQSHVRPEALPLGPVVGEILIIISHEGIGHCIGNLLKEYILVVEVLNVIKRIAVIEIHGTPGGFVGGLSLSVERGWVNIVKDIFKIMLFVGHIQKVAQIRCGSVGPYGLYGSNAIGIVIPGIIVVLHN